MFPFGYIALKEVSQFKKKKKASNNENVFCFYLCET